MRRNLDRRKWRRHLLTELLIASGLMPTEMADRKKLENLDPYELRAKAVKQKVALYELGRILFHINQRRGFKSNRKVDKKENDVGAMKSAMQDLERELMLTESKTLGAYFYKRHQNKETVRVHRTVIGNNSSYNFYTTREMYEHEVEVILREQSQHYPVLTKEVCQKIKDVIFYQRPLRAAEVGKCWLENGELRARQAYPAVHRFRILQEVNNLEIERYDDTTPRLTQEQRKKIIDALSKARKVTFAGMRRLLKLHSSVSFNLETDKRSELKGDETSAILSDAKAFGSKWYTLKPDEQRHIINLIFEEADSRKLVDTLMGDYGLSLDNAMFLSEVNLPEGYGRLSLKAIDKILPHLEKGFVYSKACELAGYNHSDKRTGEVFDHLPYYGQVLPDKVIGGTYEEKDTDTPEIYYGKVNNPSVHIAMNQLCKLVNAVIDTYGKPDEIVIELARDLKQPAAEIEKDQAKNAKENARINAELEKIQIKPNYRNRMLFKLWEDLAAKPELRCCPFSGHQIAVTDIFSGRFEEEHLLPFSRTFNDGRSNKVLSDKDWNRRKGNRSPFEAFGHEPFWQEIVARAQNLPTNKRWRFNEDAWTKVEGQDGVIARLLNDTRYMSKLAKAYLSVVFDNDKGVSNVWATSGQMTSLLRDKWGLNDLLGEDDNQKDRTDHRHHAIDAFVIGLSDRGTIASLARAAHQMETSEGLWEKRRKLVESLDEPFEHFRDELKKRIDQITISYKPDHGNAQKAITATRPYTTGALHEETALGFIRLGDDKSKYLMGKRVSIESLVKTKNIEEVADPVIREGLGQAVNGYKENSAEWKQALARYSEETGTKRVRVHTERTISALVGIAKTPDGSPYKYYATGGNYCAEIYCPNKGKGAGKWQCEIVSRFDAHRKGFIPSWKKEHPTAKLIMRLQIDDMVAYEEGGKTIINKVKKMSGERVYLRPHLIAKEVADTSSWAASAAQMQIKSARKISVDIIGRVRDPLQKKR